ncbi:B12-binding domain-containing radical SAM protein [Acidaminococcus sp. NSJ-142]|jgi:radical SAM superfamily enzyme YgiQ (UPF0313 family)|uniref:radical SAM protein n=1 Tax=Acidaminococcus TaxID=904 RepID=UPI0018F57DDA|nr:MULTISPECIES: radical SAM protein [Acidaminococcus]MCD2434549.1 B12-binding domain-containing radical SAM protein [Acidaminococcus hominis]MCH4096939.1 B12-binding domain-containing radical SAM protein [Acidaminococcus provencensis]
MFGLYFDDYETPVFRPPSEAFSFILRVTRGCAHNACTFCAMYKEVQFCVCSDEEIAKQIGMAAKYAKDQVKRIFLADGDALVLPTAKLIKILHVLYETFPNLQRVTSYAGPRDILRKSDEEMAQLREAGLKMLYLGLETGDTELLRRIKKGVTAEEAIAAGQKVIRSGMKLSMMVIAGLGGKEGSERHAIETGKAISAIEPNMLSVLTLRLYKGTEMLEQFQNGEFELLSPAGLAQEVHTMLEHTFISPERHTLFRSNHISNYIMLKGTLPQDKERLLRELEESMTKLSKLTDWEVYTNMEY